MYFHLKGISLLILGVYVLLIMTQATRESLCALLAANMDKKEFVEEEEMGAVENICMYITLFTHCTAVEKP